MAQPNNDTKQVRGAMADNVAIFVPFVPHLYQEMAIQRQTAITSPKYIQGGHRNQDGFSVHEHSLAS